jgi:hypothetical protein
MGAAVQFTIQPKPGLLKCSFILTHFINLCLAPMREDLKTKIPEKLHLCMVRRGNLRSLRSSRIRPLLTKVAIESCHADQDQIAKGLLLGDHHRNYRLGTPILV